MESHVRSHLDIWKRTCTIFLRHNGTRALLTTQKIMYVYHFPILQLTSNLINFKFINCDCIHKLLS